jgi:hypothetical protein
VCGMAYGEGKCNVKEGGRFFSQQYRQELLSLTTGWGEVQSKICNFFGRRGWIGPLGGGGGIAYCLVGEANCSA